MDNSYFGEHNEFKKYWETSEGQRDTSFSHFTAPTMKPSTNRTMEKSQFEGLNLWLYEFKAEDMD
jgi:hypothetical protein